MADVVPGEAEADLTMEEAIESEIIPPDPDTTPKISVLPSDKPGCATFVLRNEDHTMGNSLRWMLNKNKNVDFVGYTTPHPSENRLHLRVQTTDLEKHQAHTAVEESLDSLEMIFDHMIAVYEDTVRDFAESESK